MTINGIFKLHRSHVIRLDDSDVSNEEVLQRFHRQSLFQLILLAVFCLLVILVAQTVPLGRLTSGVRILIVACTVVYALSLLVLQIKQKTAITIERVHFNLPDFSEIGIVREHEGSLECGPFFGGDHFKFYFRSWTGHPSWCWVEVIQGLEITAVVFTNAPLDAASISVVNSIEYLATWACTKYDLAPRNLVVIQHFPTGWSYLGEREDWRLVEFDWEAGRAFSPEWQPLPGDTFQRVLAMAGAAL